MNSLLFCFVSLKKKKKKIIKDFSYLYIIIIEKSCFLFFIWKITKLNLFYYLIINYY